MKLSRIQILSFEVAHTWLRPHLTVAETKQGGFFWSSNARWIAALTPLI